MLLLPRSTARAANGVVLITTKRGKQGKTSFNFKANTGFSRIATNSFELMNANEAFDYQREALINYELYRADALLPTGSQYAQRATLRQQLEAKYTDAAVTDEDLLVKSRTTATDWRKVLFGGTSRLSDVSPLRFRRVDAPPLLRFAGLQ